MNTIASLSPSLMRPAPSAFGVNGATRPVPAGESPALADAKQLRQAYTQFVGETFYGQMLKAMRQSVGEPAYFHGGMAERQFQAQLDQHLAQDLAGAGAGGLADELFASQFPSEAALIEASTDTDGPLAALDQLRRR
ncbi:rod-binding protein [Botrimarina sp.]|uniref:rod-binding protein n=1 Tax=Botrimarina sp. TaxID=2795802 RepID=UPI0032ED6019